MSSLEAKREQFKRYLEQCGVLDALTRALTRLYDESDKPEDAIAYIRQNICEDCPDDEQYNKIKNDYEESQKTIAKLEQELYRFKGNLKRTESEIMNALKDGFDKLKENSDCHSLLKKHLSDEIFEELLFPLSTSNNVTLLDIIQSGLEHQDSSVGVYAGDEESYNVFEKLLKPIIIDYHGLDSDTNFQKPNDWGDPSTIVNLDPKGKYIQSTRIRIARNIKGKPYFPVLKEEGFKEIEENCKSACLNLDGKLKGTYTYLSDIDPSTYEKMVERHIMFKKGDKYLDTAGAYRFWPTGRGIFRNDDETFLVWINEEDHMRIISMTKSGDLGDVYQRLIDGVGEIGKSVEYAHDDNYGYLTSCPTNLGTTIRASVHIKLPKLSENESKLNELIKEHKLQIRGTGGEHTEIVGGVRDISNKQRLGPTEYEIIKNFQDGILKLIEVENDL